MRLLLQCLDHECLVDLLLVDGFDVSFGCSDLAGLVLLDVECGPDGGLSREFDAHHGREPVPRLGLGDGLRAYIR